MPSRNRPGYSAVMRRCAAAIGARVVAPDVHDAGGHADPLGRVQQRRHDARSPPGEPPSQQAGVAELFELAGELRGECRLVGPHAQRPELRSHHVLLAAESSGHNAGRGRIYSRSAQDSRADRVRARRCREDRRGSPRPGRWRRPSPLCAAARQDGRVPLDPETALRPRRRPPRPVGRGPAARPRRLRRRGRRGTARPRDAARRRRAGGGALRRRPALRLPRAAAGHALRRRPLERLRERRSWRCTWCTTATTRRTWCSPGRSRTPSGSATPPRSRCSSSGSASGWSSGWTPSRCRCRTPVRPRSSCTVRGASCSPTTAPGSARSSFRPAPATWSSTASARPASTRSASQRPVPPYLSQAEYPTAALALLREVGARAGLRFDTAALEDAEHANREAIERQVAGVRGAAGAGHRHREAVRRGRRRGPDRLAEGDLPTADELGAELERFLARETRGEQG